MVKSLCLPLVALRLFQRFPRHGYELPGRKQGVIGLFYVQDHIRDNTVLIKFRRAHPGQWVGS